MAADVPAKVSIFKRRWFKVVAALAVVLVLLVGVLAIAAPSIASGMAPGIVESAAKDNISGSVKVNAMSLSWGGPQLIGPLDLKDPSGATVATVTAKASAGLWALMMSGGKGDLGTLTLSGKVDLVKNADGSTNLSKAIAPTAAAQQRASAAKPSGGASTLPNVKAAVDINAIDVTFKELDAGGKVAQEASITNLKGRADVATAGGVSAKVKLDAGVKGAGGAAGMFAIDATIDNVTDANGTPTLDKMKFDATVDASKLPVPLLDALANLGGVLNEAVGNELALKIKAKGTMAQGDATINMASANVNADLALNMAANRLTASAPGSLKIGSTTFVDSAAFGRKFPQLKDALTKAGMTVSAWPGVEAKLTKLNVPVPGPGGVATLDLRGASVDADVSTGGLSGSMAAREVGGPAQAFAVAPFVMSIKSADLAQGLVVVGNTSATLGGQSAGVISINVQAKDLLDGAGKLGALAGAVGTVAADVSAKGVSTQLARPFVAGSPLDLAADVGPTLDVELKALSRVDPGAKGAAPLDIDVSVKSSNINAVSSLRLADSVLTSRSTTALTVGTSSPLVQRILTKNIRPGDAPVATIGGTGAVEVSISDLSLPMKDGFDLANLGAKVKAEMKGLSAALPGKQGQPAPAPVAVEVLTNSLTFAKGQAPTINVVGRMSHEGKPFTLAGDLALPGLMETLAAKSASPTAMIPGMEKLRITGQVALTGVPSTLSKAAGLPTARAATDTTTGVDVGAIVDALLKDMVGQGVDVGIKFAGPATGQSIDATVKAAALNVVVGADLSAKEMKVRQFSADATVKPETAKRLAEATGTPKDQIAGVNMRGPATVTLVVEPITVPISTANGKIEPQPANIAQPIKATLALREPLIVSGLPLSKDQVINGGLSGFKAEITAPAAAVLDPKSTAPVNLTVDGQLVLDDGKPVATLVVRGAYVLSTKAVDVTAGVRQINTAGVDRLIGKPNLLAGALGETADVEVLAKGPADALNLSAKVNSPRLKGADLALKTDNDRITISAASGGAAKIDWTLDPAFAAAYVFAGKDAQGNAKPATMRLLAPAPVTVELRSMVLAQSKPPSNPLANDATGPLKPGIFATDIELTIPKLALEVDQPAQPAAEGRPAQGPGRLPVTLDSVKATVKTTAANTLSVTARIGAVGSGVAASTQPVTANVTLTGLADAYGRELDQSRAKISADIKADRFPTAVLDGVSRQEGQLVKLLGDQIDLSVKAKDAVLKGSGEVTVDVSAKRSGSGQEVLNFSLAAPIVPGQLATTLGTFDLSNMIQRNGLDVKLYDYKYEVDTDLVKIFPLFASVAKAQATSGPPVKPGEKPAPLPAGVGPSTIISRNLRIPVPEAGGANRLDELTGEIEVDLGRIDYTFKREFGQFLDSALFNKGTDQKPISKFTVRIDRGVISYDTFEIPVRQYSIKTKGTVNLNNRQVNMTIFVPTLALAPGVMDKLSKDAGGVLRNLAPGLITEATMVPISIKGPMDSPSYALDGEAFIRNLGDQLRKQPENIIKGIGDLFGPKKKDK